MEDYHRQIENILGPGGLLSRTLPGFVFRQEQYDLAMAIAQAFSQDDFILAEAGTGVGKSYAYIVPAILWAVNTRETVVLATKTKALQTQLMEKDIPSLHKCLGVPFSFTQVKGRENYLCMYKYQQIKAGRTALDDEQKAMVENILLWAERTSTGDRMELNLSSSLLRHWSILAADRQSCQRDKCRYQERCFRLKMARKARHSNIIVTNHAMLISDLATGSQVFPDFRHVIIDEAHVFPQEVFDHSSFRFNREEVQGVLDFFYQRGHGHSRGFLMAVRQEYPGLQALATECSELVVKIKPLLRDIFIAAALPPTVDTGNGTVFMDSRLPEEWYERVGEIHDAWYQAIMALTSKMREMAEAGEELEQLVDLSATLEDLAADSRNLLYSWIYQEERICWLDQKNGQVESMCSARLDQSSLINELLYNKMASVVMLSATLTVDHSFSAFSEKAALLEYERDGRLRTYVAGSPFNYEDNAALFIVDDLPDPANARFDREVAELLSELASPAWGKTLILFTSKRSLSTAAAMLRPVCRDRGIELLVQNEDGDFGSLIDRFIGLDHAILAGVDTFWEGIDLRGDLLKLLIIVKMPFRPPTNPYYGAWERHYRSAGLNPFKEFMLPDAALRFKQGSGRLIRSEEDRGVLVVLDRRLIAKDYGSTILNSIPIKNVDVVGRRELPEKLKEWL